LSDRTLLLLSMIMVGGCRPDPRFRGARPGRAEAHRIISATHPLRTGAKAAAAADTGRPGGRRGSVKRHRPRSRWSGGIGFLADADAAAGATCSPDVPPGVNPFSARHPVHRLAAMPSA
jgi:hypothetical protein